jgi:hypothetical protein
MKKILAFAAAFALFASTQAFAIIGAGAHYVHNMGATLKGNSEDVKSIDGGKITLKRDEATDLQGLGFKAWIDFLPFVDLEATFNIAATRYSPCLNFEVSGIPGSNPIAPVCLEYTPEAPFGMVFGKASPIYGVASGDLSITYPIDLPIIRPYAGAGVSYMLGMPLVDKKFAETVLDKTPGLIPDLSNPQPIDQEKISKAFSDALKNSDYTSGIGAHIIVGVRAKLPVIPIAAYANTKYYFGGGLNSKFSQGVVFEVGGGLAI